MCECLECSILIVIYNNTYSVTLYEKGSKPKISSTYLTEPLDLPNNLHKVHLVFKSEHNHQHELLLLNINRCLSLLNFCQFQITVNGNFNSFMHFLEIFSFTNFRELKIDASCNLLKKIDYIASFIEVFGEKYVDIKVKFDIVAFQIIFDD